MTTKSPYSTIKSVYVTEKTRMLQGLKSGEQAGARNCNKPKLVFLVDPKATKGEIAYAVESIYKEHGVKVRAVNTVRAKPKPTRKRHPRGAGHTAGFKKAIVTFDSTDNIDNLL